MGKYDDIIYLDHPTSKNHERMSIYDRSAQFAPFAALVGYEETIKDKQIKLDQRVELGSDKTEEISKVLSYLLVHLNEHPYVTITYFKKDKVKDGGEYIFLSGNVTKFDINSKTMTINKRIIKITDIIDITVEGCSYE